MEVVWGVGNEVMLEADARLRTETEGCPNDAISHKRKTEQFLQPAE